MIEEVEGLRAQIQGMYAANDAMQRERDRLRETLDKVRHVARHNAAVDSRYLIDLLDSDVKAG